MKRSKTVVVTGASVGLGRAVAYAFAKEGARVGLISREKQALDETAKEVTRLGGKATVVVADVSDDAAVEAAASKIEEELGPIDVWVNSASVSIFAPVREMQAKEYRHVTEVNYLGYVNGTLSALRRMLPRNKGRIIQVGSALAYRSVPLQSANCATQYAIVGFTDSLRSELYHDKSKVKVAVVHIPAMNTPQFTWMKSRLPRMLRPLPPIYTPEAGAGAVLDAAFAHMPRREYWVNGSTVKMLMGQKIVPGLLDRYLGRYGYESAPRDFENSASPNDLQQTTASLAGAQARPVRVEAKTSRHRGLFAFACGVVGAALWLRKMRST